MAAVGELLSLLGIAIRHAAAADGVQALTSGGVVQRHGAAVPHADLAAGPNTPINLNLFTQARRRRTCREYRSR